MNIEVSFWVKGATGDYMYESELEEYISELKTFDNLPGIITIRDETRCLELFDDLDYLVPLWCFSSIPSLLKEEPFHVLRSSASGWCKMESDQGTVLVSGDQFEAVTFNKKQLIKALFQCGSRFLEFIKQLNEGKELYSMTIIELQNGLRKVEALLS